MKFGKISEHFAGVTSSASLSFLGFDSGRAILGYAGALAFILYAYAMIMEENN